jgi:carboxylesterase type B
MDRAMKMMSLLAAPAPAPHQSTKFILLFLQLAALQWVQTNIAAFGGKLF